MKKTKEIPVPPPPGYLEAWRKTPHTCLLTGATEGLGRALAIRLADAGQRLAVVSRSREKLNGLMKDLNDAGPHQQHISFQADLSSMADTGDLAERLLHKLPDLSRIILCASALPGFQGRTPEGFEVGLAVNFLSRVRLVNQLVPALKKREDARIITYTPMATGFSLPDLTSLNDGDCPLNDWQRNQAHASCNMLHVAELAAELHGTNVKINAFSPGLVLTQQAQYYSALRRFYLGFLSAFIGKSPAYAALPTMHMLLSPDFASVTGSFFKGESKLSLPTSFPEKQTRNVFFNQTLRMLIHQQQGPSAQAGTVNT